MEWPPTPPHLPDAACRGADPALFFPNKDRAGRAALRKALSICRRCPEIERCREYALAGASLVGIWGGLSGGQRVVLGRKFRRGSVDLVSTEVCDG